MDVSSFLGRYPPFDALEPERLARVAAEVEIEHFAPGVVILQQAGEPSKHLYVIRKGAVEILDEGRLIDLMVEGETFGAWSVLGSFSPTASVRAHEDTLCYLIPAASAAQVLGTSKGIAFVMGNLRRRIARIDESWRTERVTEQYRSVSSLIRREPVTIGASATVADAARTMAERRVSCLLVTGGRQLGIVTDRDLRTRVVAERRDPGTTTVAQVMTHPAETVAPDTMAGEVLLRMVEGGFHHFPVEDGRGGVLGVVTDTDLMGLGRHTPFSIKSAIERAPDRDGVVASVRDLPNVVTTLVEARTEPVEIGHIVGLTIDALTRRLLELGIAQLGDPPVPWAWFALGSAARHEQALHTDQDHALAFDPQGRDAAELDPYFAELAELVTSGLEAAGIPRCSGDAMASNAALRMPLETWLERFRGWMADPGATGSVLLSIVFDYRRVAGPLDVGSALDDVVRLAPTFPPFLRHLARRGLDDRPPTGFFRDLVVEARGEHAGRLDVKHGGITIVGNLARSYAIGAGLVEKRTIPRLRAAAEAGAIEDELAAGLEEAFRFLWGVRLEHQVRRIRAGEPADDFVDPAELGPITRHGLKEAFRAIARAQRLLASDLGVTQR